MAEPMTSERLAEIRSWISEWSAGSHASTRKSASHVAAELLNEVDRLTAERDEPAAAVQALSWLVVDATKTERRINSLWQFAPYLMEQVRDALAIYDGPIRAACPNAASHTVGPQGYVAWHEWAEQMARTHQQALCSGCDRWLIWTSRTPGGAT